MITLGPENKESWLGKGLRQSFIFLICQAHVIKWFIDRMLLKKKINRTLSLHYDSVMFIFYAFIEGRIKLSGFFIKGGRTFLGTVDKMIFSWLMWAMTVSSDISNLTSDTKLLLSQNVNNLCDYFHILFKKPF